MKKLFLFFFLITIDLIIAQSGNYNIINYGAIGDGKTINTTAIQKAIDDCSASGGGTVVIPAGEFISGVFQLKNNVTLFLNNGSVLKGSSNLEDYILNGVSVGLIFTKDCNNVMIKGDGIIDLNGDKFNFMTKRKTFKPDEYKKYTRQGMSYASDSAVISDGPAEPHEKRPYQSIIFSN